MEEKKKYPRISANPRSLIMRAADNAVGKLPPREVKQQGKPRGRIPGFAVTDEHRSKIQQTQILNALQEHVNGKREMSATQVTAATVLLKKVLPDLTQSDVTTRSDNAPIEQLDDAALAQRIAALEAERGEANAEASDTKH